MSQTLHTASHLTIKRLGGHALHNYEISDEYDKTIARVNWLNVNGIRTGWGSEGELVEFSEEMEIEIANPGGHGDNGAGAYIRPR